MALAVADYLVLRVKNLALSRVASAIDDANDLNSVEPVLVCEATPDLCGCFLLPLLDRRSPRSRKTSHSRRAAPLVPNAVKAAGPAGRLIRLEGETIKVLFETVFSPHQLGLSDLLAALSLVGKAPRRVIVVGVVPQDLSVGMDLSPAVARGRDAAVTMIVDELTRLGIAPMPRLQ